MFFDTARASSLLSTLAMFVSTTSPGNQHHHVDVETAVPNNMYHSCKSPPAFLPRSKTNNNRNNNNRIPTVTTRAAVFHPSFTALNSDDNNSAGMTPAETRTKNKNLMVPFAVKQEKYVALLDWLKSSGATVNDCLEIKKSSTGEQAGYGVFVDRPVKQGEVLFAIPRNLCVTIEKATTSDDDDGTFGNGLQTLVDRAGPGGSTVAMAGYMAKEYILLYLEKRDEKRAGNNNDANNDNNKNIVNSNSNSRWGPYMELLPWKRGVNNQEHVLFWNEAKIEELLRGSMCYSEAISLRREVALSISVLSPLLKRSVRMARGDLSTNAFERFTDLLPWQQYTKKQDPDDDLDDILDDQLIGNAVKGAFVTLLTRSFADDDDDGVAESSSSTDAIPDTTRRTTPLDNDDEIDDDGYSEKLVPLLDLLQHSDTPNVRHNVVVGSNNEVTVEVRARVDIEPGSEVYNQYRSEEDEAMPYSRFFTRFGFVPGIDEPIENLLIDKSPIFYPQKAEV